MVSAIDSSRHKDIHYFTGTFLLFAVITADSTDDFVLISFVLLVCTSGGFIG